MYAHRMKRRYDSKKKMALRRGRTTAADLIHAKRLQLRQYEALVDSGAATEWTRAKIATLKLELT